jgi:hypothetical protein
VIELKENGEVVGVIPAVGCTMSGLATQFLAEYMASVDVSLKGCRDDRFNTRFSGHLTASKASKVLLFGGPIEKSIHRRWPHKPGNPETMP